MSDTESQTDAIVQYLLEGNSITPIEALGKFGCFRLGARVWDAKKRGHDIVTEWETDGKKRWARYRLAGPVQRRLAI